MHALTLRSIKVQKAGTEEANASNIRANLERGLQEFQPALTANDGHFVIVGSGPSVISFLAEIRQERDDARPICAIKGAHDWLIDNGLEPDFFVTCEPRMRPMRHKSERTVYLLASRCTPELFEFLADKRIVIWHSLAAPKRLHPKPGQTSFSWEELEPDEECEAWRGRFGVGGGTTSGLRAINLGYLMGFRKFILYGFDSCLSGDRDTKRFTGEGVGEGWKTDVIVGGRRFWCNGALAMQAVEFQELYRGMDMRVEVKGDGLLAAIVAERHKRGMRA